jgi:hypothetical protein
LNEFDKKAIDLDTLLTLQEACDIEFRGLVKVSTLRLERDRGNLVVERIGRREFVTLRAVREMREKCRVQKSPPTSGSNRQNSMRPAGCESKPGGSSAIADGLLAQAATRATLRALSERLKTTSKQKGRSRASATPIKS